MKTRTGFVSNSSSSSFIVGFEAKHLPQSVEDMKRLLFDDLEEHAYYSDQTFSTLELATRVFQDFHGVAPLTEKQILEILRLGELEDCLGEIKQPNIEDYCLNKEQCEYDWDAYNNDYDASCQKLYDDLIKPLQGELQYYLFDYSDNKGDFECCLEHGQIFEPLWHFQISRH